MLETLPSLPGVGMAEGTQRVPPGVATTTCRTSFLGWRSSDPSFLLQDLERLFEANGIKVGNALIFLLTRCL